MGECVTLRIWRAGAPRPTAASRWDEAELVLGRDLVAPEDRSLSRRERAPRLRLVDGCPGLHVPLGSLRATVVLRGVHFESLCQGTEPAALGVTPAQLLEVGRLVEGPWGAWWFAEMPHHGEGEVSCELVSVPRPLRVDPGATLRLTEDTLVLMGTAAMELRVGEQCTGIPPLATSAARQGQRFSLPHEAPPASALGALESLEGQGPLGPLRVPELRRTLERSELPGAAAKLMAERRTSHLFFPVLQGDRLPLLAFGFRRRDGSVGALLSGRDVKRWAGLVATYLRGPAPQGEAHEADAGVALAATPEPTPDSSSALPRSVVEVLSPFAHGDQDFMLSAQCSDLRRRAAAHVHQRSGRRGSPFLRVSCENASEEWLRAALFGVRADALPISPESRPGFFERAENGTLLIDAVEEAPLRIQLALLRVLETRTFRAIGATAAQPLRARIIAGAGQDLERALRRGALRIDLYYRLSALCCVLPVGDGGALDPAVEGGSRFDHPTLPPEAPDALAHHPDAADAAGAAPFESLTPEPGRPPRVSELRLSEEWRTAQEEDFGHHAVLERKSQPSR